MSTAHQQHTLPDSPTATLHTHTPASHTITVIRQARQPLPPQSSTLTHSALILTSRPVTLSLTAITNEFTKLEFIKNALFIPGHVQ